ncbi:hypothetical protein GCM10027059_02030 [Myceligenerans halotolerans]
MVWALAYRSEETKRRATPGLVVRCLEGAGEALAGVVSYRDWAPDQVGQVCDRATRLLAQVDDLYDEAAKIRDRAEDEHPAGGERR